ncbi:MAG: CPBP family intramembrane metalloprotease, partial [Alphaproteobacteria bacterium]|nr:CPBP family intramembrane metalloprotease [Alphaproteobacteria bacterium]
IASLGPIRFWPGVLWTVGTFVAVLVAFVLFAAVTLWTDATLFGWYPDWLQHDAGILARPENAVHTVLAIAVTIVLVLVVSVTEEVYFRGYLLPRLGRYGLASVALNALLFAVYHFATPGALVQRAAMTVPLAFSAVKSGSLIPAIAVHVIANAVDTAMRLGASAG